MKNVELKGIITPILTPMNEDETVNLNELCTQIDRLIDGGVHDAICKAFTYGYLKGQRAERKIHERGVINEQQRLFERNPRHAGG